MKDDRPAPKPQKGAKKRDIPIPTAATIPLLAASRLTLEALPAADSPQRNLFAFEEDPVVVAKRKKDADDAAAKAAEAAKIAAAEAEKRRIAEQKFLEEHPLPPPINFEFLGYFGDPKKRIGVFSPKGGGDVTLAVEGDKIFGTYQVKEIGFESAEIGFDNFKETKRIPISATSGGK